MQSIWRNIKKPIVVLAPMADVTDSAFRQIIAKKGKPDLFYTEFVSADGLCSDLGRPKLLRDLYFTEEEKPIIAQIFSSKPNNIKKAARLCLDLGFDGVDINMGCPDRTIEKQGAGACLIKTPELAKDIVLAAKEGAKSSEKEIPVSVKTRIGYNQIQIEDWAKNLLETKPEAIIFHLRTRKEMSKVPAQWDLIEIPRDMAKGTGTLILGNGDVKSVSDGVEKAEKYNIDGVMIGRAIFGNPWLFSKSEPDRRERIKTLIEHIELFNELYGDTENNQKFFGGHRKNFAVMKKHFKSYLSGLPDSREILSKIMEEKEAGAITDTLKSYL